MANKRELNYGINLEINKASVDNLKRTLTEVENNLKQAIAVGGPSKEFEKSLKAAQDLRSVLNSSWNNKLNQLDLSKVNEQLVKSYGSVKNFKEALESTSSVGARAYNDFSKIVLNTNLQLAQSSKLLDEMADTLGKTIKWGIASRVMNDMVGSIEKAWSFSVQLDKSLNDIRIVTNKSAEDMDRFAETANRAAKTLGASTRDYTEASLIYYQQGLSDKEAQKRAEITLKAANVTGQSTKEVSEQLTAVWNGYNVTVQESELYIDKLAAVAASTAADLEELSTGMSKVASAANVMGVDVDQLNAQLATIVSVTRQAPESVGVALKTIYSRMGDIKAGLDKETTLGNYTSKMAKLGINVLDANNQLRDMGDVVEEVGSKWNTLTKEQQVSLAQTMAGTRQYNNLLALFENWDMYTEALETSANAAGTLQKQQDIYMESVEAHLQKMKTEAEETYKTLFDVDTVNSFIDVFTDLNSLLNVFLKGLGGGMNDFVYLGTLITQILNKQIAGGLDNFIQKFETFKSNKATIAMLQAINEEGFSTAFNQQGKYVTEATTNQFGRTEDLLKLQPSMKAEDFNTLNGLSQEIAYYEEIVNLKQLALEESSSESEVLENQINELEAQNTKLKEKITLTKKGEFSKQDVKDWMSQEGFTSAERSRLNTLLKSSGSRSLSEEDSREILEIEEKAQERINRLLQQKYNTKENIRNTEEMSLNQVKEKLDLDQEEFNILKKQAERQQDISKNIIGLSALTQLGVTLSGISKTIKDAQDGTIEWSEALSQVAMVLPVFLSSGVQAISWLSQLPPHVLVVTAAIAALVAAIGFAINEISLFVDRERVLKQELEANKKAVEETSKAYDELKTTVSDYKDARKAIDSLTSGTLEFYEAILQANEQAEKLIELLDLQAGSQYQIDSNGLISINDEALQQGMFSKAQESYKAQLDQAMTQYALDQRERDKQTEKLITQFQKDVSSKTQGGYGISYEQAKQMIDEFTLEENEVNISIGELQKALENSNADNFEDLCTLITKEMAEVKAPLNEIKEKRDTQAAQIGSQAIRAYGAKEQVEKLDNLPKELRTSINESIGKAATNEIDRREKASLGGRNITNPLEQWYGVLGNFYNNNKIFTNTPGMRFATSGARMYSNYLVGQQQNYNETKAVPQTVVSDNLEKRIEEMNNNLNKALEGGFAASAGGKYIAQAQYEAKYNGEVSESTLNKMTPQELEFALNNSEKLRNSLLVTNQTVDEYIQKMREANGPLDEWGRTQARAAADSEEYKNRLDEAAQELDVSSKTMELYGDAVINAGKAEKRKDATTAESIKTMASFNKTYNEAIKLYDDNKDALKEYADAIKNKVVPSLEAAEGAAAVSEKLEKMGLSLSGEQLANNLGTINTLLTGTEEEAKDAYNQLLKLSYINILEGFDTSAFDDLKIGIEDFADYLSNLNPGAELDEKFTTALINMINNSKMTAEEIQNLLGSLNIEAPKMDANVEYHEEEIEHPPRKLTYEGDIPISGGLFKKEKKRHIKYTVTETQDPTIVKYATLGEGQVFKKGNTYSPKSFARAPSNSGRGGSSAEAKTVDYSNEEADRYHEVDTQIKKVDNSLKQLQSQTKKLVGEELIENLNKQWEQLNQQVENYNEKLRIAQGEQAELRNKLARQGVAFNADGTVGNYVQAFQNQQNQLNSVIGYYNSLSSQDQKWYQSTLDAAQERFKQFQKDMDRYDTLVSDTIPGLNSSIQDAIDKQIDIQIQEFDMEIEIRLKLSEAEKDWNEFKKKIIDDVKDDDILGNATAKLIDFSSYYKENDTGAVQALRKQIDDTLTQLGIMDEGKTSRVYGNNRARALEDLKKYYDELRKQMQDVLELQEEIHQSYIDMMDEAQDKFDEQIESYEMISNLIEHDMNVISLVYGEEAYHQLSNFYDKQQANYNAQLDFQKQQVKFWKAQMDAAEQGTKAWDAAREKWASAVENLNSLIETSIQNLQDKYTNTINAIFQDLNNKVTNGLGLSYVEEEWNLINKNAEQYLDTINQMYNVQALENKYIKAINDTKNVTVQKQLKKIMDEELAGLRERDKLTQYDVDRANKKYEIALKQIALEEAQQNKNQMRLRRDTQGNYRYEFVSDIDQVNQLQNDLDDLYNSLYNFDKENYADNLNQLYDVWNEFQQKMAEAAQINDPEARAERELLIQEQYGELINSLVEQNQTIRSNLYDSAFEDLSRLYDEDKNKFLEMAKEEQDAIIEGLIPSWDAGIQHMADTFVNENGFLNVCKDAFEELNDMTQLYEDELKEIQETADISFGDLSSGIDELIPLTQQLLKDNNDLIDSYVEQMNAISGVVNELDELIEKYKESADQAERATTAAYNYWSEQQRQAAEKARKDQEEKDRKAAEEAARKKAAAAAPAPTPAPAPSYGGDGVPRVGDVVNYVNGRYTADSYGGGNSGAVGLGGQVRITIVKEDGRPRPIHIARLSGGALGWVSRGQITGYDTGGYTGEWGNTGRLALLHQKELVLNKEDTKNLLNAVNVMRTITDAIGTKVLERLSIASSNNNFANNVNGMLDQNVHIEANFPNVKNSHEIEDALNNLVNMAAQRTQSKER